VVKGSGILKGRVPGQPIRNAVLDLTDKGFAEALNPPVKTTLRNMLKA
jgi:hypothetical protein